MNHFDVIVLGGGHAGIEAAYCASQFSQLKIGIITLPGVGLASAPCNPSVGGIGKGQVVKEIDALGGLMGILTDLAGIQYRTLNESKGLAVQSTRVQIDKISYSKYAEEIISKISNIKVIRNAVISISYIDNHYCIKCHNQDLIFTNKLIITAGTFLGGLLHCGSETKNGGRLEQVASVALNELLPTSVTKKRFKTGTPARIAKSSINFSQVEEQPSDDQVRNMHLWNSGSRNLRQVSCYLTRTNSDSLKIIRDNKEKSPMYNGQITAVGARYCPSIEDKAYRYPDKNVHHVFLEPEGLEIDTYYPSGISTSLPKDIQLSFIRTIKGLEAAEIVNYGYAVEYDVMDTSKLSLTLEHNELAGLYFAGQVNGTSGYEEAAGQGLVAGFNAALSLVGEDKLILNRNQSYIGLMVDDLVSSDRDEPYRLFTARSENRLYLREDNAFYRMGEYRKMLNISNMHDKLLQQMIKEYELCKAWIIDLPTNEQFKSWLDSINYPHRDVLPRELLKDPNYDPRIMLSKVIEFYNIKFSRDIVSSVAIDVKYQGYIDKALEQFKSIQKLESKKINLEKALLSKNISFECKQRIEKFKPETFGQLKRLSGIRPATLAVVATDSL
jgi:tRNA uridine 5-carboxymethylaminomethyl modification enzyme